MTSASLTDRCRTVDLASRQLWIVDGRPGTSVQVLAGGIWLTEADNLEDRVAGAGQWLRIESRGRAVAEALGPSRLRVVAPARRRGAPWRDAARRWLHRGDRIALRSLALTLSLLLGLGVPEMLARGFGAAGPLAPVAVAATPATAAGATVA